MALSSKVSLCLCPPPLPADGLVPLVPPPLPFISVLLHLYAAALLYMVSEALYGRLRKPPPPIISAAHVFEEVGVFQLNAKQDLLGLSPAFRHFIADSVSELAA